MTNEEYLSIGASKCPCCSSSNIAVTDHIQQDGCDAWQEVSCDDCNAIWHDVYKMVGYEIKRNPKN